MTRYGVVEEGRFISSETRDEMSATQASALAAMNEALKSGSLSTPEARRNKATVRAALDAASDLSSSVKTQLTKVFGAGYVRNLTSRAAGTNRETASTSGTCVKRTRDISVRYSPGPGLQPVNKKLSDAIAAWREVDYPSDWEGDAARRAFQKRFQRALHDRQPVVMSWFVDFNALDDEGRFFEPPASPGRQGGHMVVMEAYEIDEVPGFGTLAAGTVETRPAALEAALDDAAKLKFIRVENSWGSEREDRAFSQPGYHDLYMSYLNGPVEQCAEVNHSADPNNCWDKTPFGDIVLPPGY